jgi:hypothetical protein
MENRMSDTNHTPTPWALSDRFREDIVDREGELLASAYSMDIGGDHAAAANAAFIVRAVNSHEQLVAALAEIKSWTDAALTFGFSDHQRDTVRDVLVRATEALKAVEA